MGPVERRAWHGRALACFVIGCVGVSSLALLLLELRSALLRASDDALLLEKARSDAEEDEFDWCVTKAKHGACSSPSVARWCAQVCQATDLDGSCLQSILDIKCSRILPNSAARIDEERWGCYTGLFQSEARACVADSGDLEHCYAPDLSATWVDAEDQLRAVIADNGCNQEEPPEWAPEHPHNATGCTDMLPWSSLTGRRRRGEEPAHECADYAHHGWCAGNEMLDKSRGGRANNWPEEHCCACGGGNTLSPDMADAEVCVESQMAVHLALASYYNGTELKSYLPNHFTLVREFHASKAIQGVVWPQVPLSAEGFVATGAGACWVAFRGSQEDADWVTDITSAMSADARASNNHSLGQAGVGFYESWSALRSAGLVREVVRLLKEGRCEHGVRVTGHSLGAAIASIAAADLFTLSAYPADAPPELRIARLTPSSLRVYTFGEPRGLRWYAADWFNSNVAKVRWLNWGDPIPASPPAFWGFKHWYARGVRGGDGLWGGQERDGACWARSDSDGGGRETRRAFVIRRFNARRHRPTAAARVRRPHAHRRRPIAPLVGLRAHSPATSAPAVAHAAGAKRMKSDQTSSAQSTRGRWCRRTTARPGCTCGTTRWRRTSRG
jgi:hypothetical protein